MLQTSKTAKMIKVILLRAPCQNVNVLLSSITCIIFAVPWRGGVKQQWGNRKHGFSRLSTLRLQQLWKSGQSYYTVILFYSFVVCPLTTKYLAFNDSEWLEYPF